MSIEESPAKLALHRLPLYNPSRLKDAEIIAAFVTREPLMRRIVADIAAEKPRSRAQHHLIVGQRGMGKTLLLARIAAELRTSSLKDRFIPLVFAEEQYSIDRLSKFWLNCLDSLADEHDRAGNTAAVDEIDNTVRRLTPRLSGSGNDTDLSRETLEAFLQAAAATGRRPVLLVDNLQIVFERISPDEQHMLREALMRAGCPILVGASPIQPAATERYDAAFYDQFKTHYLSPLSVEEMQSLMLHLATAVDRAEVRDRVLQNPERVKVLRQLTGGSPRTTATLFFLYAEDFAPDVFGDLENLLDRVTPLYKAVFEDLPAQQQVLGSAIANHWDPITARQLAEITGLAPGKVSPQLDRMEKSGFIEKVELFNSASTGYQIAERFFNVWFLMRSASRRQRREVEFLTRFLQTIYEAPERDELALHLMRECNLSADRYLFTRAVAASLEQDSRREDLIRFADMDVLRQRDRKARRELAEILDLSTLPTATLEFASLRDRLKELLPPNAPVTPDEFADQVLGDRRMFRDGQREKLAAREIPLTADEIEKVLSVIEKARQTDTARFSSVAVNWFSARLTSGQLRSARDAEDWNRAFKAAENREIVELSFHTLPDDFGCHLCEETHRIISSHYTPGPGGTGLDWVLLAITLITKLQRFGEAEVAYREAIKLNPNSAGSWNGLGNLLQDHLQRFDESEAAYREAIERDPNGAMPWIGLGKLLHTHLQRFEEAEAAYKEAIERDPIDALPWADLGHLLKDHTQRFTEAEAAYREAIRLNPNFTYAWNGLGNLLTSQLRRYDEAETAYREAINIEPTSEIILSNLISLYRDILGNAAAARPFFDQLSALPTHDYRYQLFIDQALFRAYENNWGLTTEALAIALDSTGNRFTSTSSLLWKRAGAVLLHLNYGEQLLKFLEEQGASTRLRPWYEALKALHQGDRRYLQNIAPEIRGAAENFYDQMEFRLNNLPDSTRRRPLPSKPKRAGGRKA